MVNPNRNPFTIFTTNFELCALFKQIIDADVPLTRESEDRVLSSIIHHPNIIADLTAKETRQLRSLARNITVEPWPIPPDNEHSGFASPSPAKSHKDHPSSTQPIGMSFLPVSRKLNVSLNIPEQFSTSLAPKNIYSLPIPGDPYDPATHGLHSVFPSSSSLSDALPIVPNLIALSDFMPAVSSPFSIRNVSQYVNVPSASLHCSAFGIPVSCESNPPKSVTEPVPLVDTQASVPIVSIPFAASSQKGKGKIVFSGTEKRKHESLDDVDMFSPKLQRKSSLLPPRVKRSRAKTFVTNMSPSTATAKSAPSSSQPLLKKNYSPILLDSNLKADWEVHSKRDLIIEKFINEEDLLAKCNILPLLKDQLLFSMDTFTNGSSRFHKVFIRNRWYAFGLAEINAYLDRPSQVQSVDLDLNLLIAVLTHNKRIAWPENGLKSQELTIVYSILLRLASANWLPAVRVHHFSEQLALLLYKIRNRLTFDLGEIIFSHILAYHVKKKEAKIHLPYPCLIYGLLLAQGFRPYNDEQVTKSDIAYVFDDRLTQFSHYDDRDSLYPSSVPTPPLSAPVLLVPKEVSLSESESAPVTATTAIPKKSPTLLLRSSIASQQATLSGFDKLLEEQLREIFRLETIHANILAASRNRTSAIDDDATSSDSGTPSAR
ncbi:PREDICTED: uncharacterized protein LOC109168966 [Ipomoea nil]|uniref:uncharacterized protein LOC109168966 n=1 Tax=Ipomoea nil TaxID=35883 RepID=UPI00090186FF|nr:PREDICTED: uncharacterized protein LOC109168966 [Ipomoea nil]